MIVNLISVALILLIYLISQSIALTIVGSFAVVLIMRSLNPIFIMLWDKYFPKPEIRLIREQDLVDEPGHGVRILVATQHIEFKPDDEALMTLYKKILSEAIEELQKKKPIFELRYSKVLERKLPIRCFSCVCGEKDSGMRKCYRAFLSTVNAKDFGTWKENSELFLHDGVFDDPTTGEAKSSLVMFLFDSRLPKTIVPKEENTTEKKPEDTNEEPSRNKED